MKTLKEVLLYETDSDTLAVIEDLYCDNNTFPSGLVLST